MTHLLHTGQTAPFFQALNQQQTAISLSDFVGKNLVLYFYPKDDTPGCTLEAQQFTALADAFATLNTAVVGISQDDCASHQAFIDKYQLNVQLLADTDGSICQNYGVWQEVEKDGVKKWKIVRSTFIIDPQGQLASVEYSVNPDGHAQTVLEHIQHMNR